MTYYKTRDEIEIMRESVLIVSKTLGLMAQEIKPGISTLELDKIAEEFIRDHGGEPGFKGYGGFPNTLCTSVNEQVVHGIPNDIPLKDGDIVSIDCGVKKNDFYGDHAYTFMIGEVDPETQRLVEVTKQCLDLGIEQVKLGNHIGDISYAVQQHAQKHGFSVVRELVGHGVGRNLHEKPDVPNFGRRGNGPKIQNGLVLAIEPMINLGKRKVLQLRDGWTIVTVDKKPSAHFEHNVAIIDGKTEVLSTFEFVEEALAQKV
ncbi:type I methionyl aminopeptidase [Rapidithrix thailandica]|uniref:Methionine aminopeptidase n=1 Tax=Rapidithrix thailandica TaxID=413964 RepID=A0AAW9RYA2_9BACT